MSRKTASTLVPWSRRRASVAESTARISPMSGWRPSNQASSSSAGRSSSMTRTFSGMPALPSCLHPGGELRHPDEDLRSSARSGLDHQAIVVAEGVTQPHVYVAQADRVELRVPGQRSEEHTSELQSLMRISYAVLC